MHREVPVQVTAWVDEGVAELVTALNVVPGLMTLDSCQERPDGRASVMFCIYDRALLYDAVGRIARAIGDGQRGNVTLSLWWGYGGEVMTPQRSRTLTCPPALVSHVAHQVRANAARMTRSALWQSRHSASQLEGVRSSEACGVLVVELCGRPG
jgi:hypothetical protein